MKTETSELSGKALDRMVGLLEGKAHREPRLGTDAEAAALSIPFAMYEVVRRFNAATGDETFAVSPITVTRYGINVKTGATAPSIDFTDAASNKATGSVSMFYFDKVEAELEARGEQFGYADEFSPSSNWEQGGLIIDRERIATQPVGHQWIAGLSGRRERETSSWSCFGPTLLVAAMRCYVAARLGAEVDVPHEFAPA
jgi:hypothetical protein